MTLNSYLERIANAAVLRDDEAIRRSVDTIGSRLDRSVSGISERLLFGSFSRGTCLPRSMDPQSDVDLMVVFADSQFRPQTYLDRLKRFVESAYSRSEIYQSSPTVVLELNHIKFDLVPAIRQYGVTYIPAKASDYSDWTATEPREFNDRLSAANQANQQLVKPLARVVKYWNSKASYPFESYALEQMVVRSVQSGYYGTRNLAQLFVQFVNSLTVDYGMAQWKQTSITRLKEAVGQAVSQNNLGYNVDSILARVLPLP